jgi:hypothetical protein
MRALITMPEQTTDALPRIYIKVPQETRFDEVAVAFGPLNLMRYPVGWVFSLSLRLQDATGRILEADALGDPISDRRILHKLASAPSVEMVALADSSSFPVLGAKLLNWSPQKQKRAQSLFVYTRVAKLSGSWKQARISYLYEHPQGYIFQELLPDTVGQRDVEVGTAREDDQLPMPHHEETISPGPLQVEKSEIPHSTEATSETAPTKHASDVSLLVEQFILLHRAGVHAEYHHTHTLSRGIFWRFLLAIALEQTQRKFIWTPEAVRMIESRRQQLTPSETLPWLSSREHLWIAFAEPIETPVCAETAALFVFSSSAPSLLSEFAQQVQMSSRALKALERTLYTPEKQRVIFNIINRTGAIVWAISLRTDAHIRLDDAEAIWSATAWYTCPRLQCHLHNAEIDTLCETCTSARTFTWTWLFAAWQSLQGLYRDKPVTDRFLETVGIEQSEHVSRVSQEPDGKGVVGRADLTYRYQVVREIDIASAPPPTEPKSRSQRGSWVEMLSSIDPSLVFYDKREIPLRTRTLKHPRYARYIAQTGTNQVEVRPHIRHVPMRSNPKGMTQVTAKPDRKDVSKE